MKILVTGGAGFIGSHTTLCLVEDGHEVVVLDNLSNSHAESLRRVQEISGTSVEFRQVDLLDVPALNGVLAEFEFDAVIHFAGLKAVGESVEEPLKYYQNNVVGTLNLLHSMEKAGLFSLIFSSSATVYGAADKVPLNEETPLDATNPYGRTKEQIEDILSDLAAADPRWSVAMLRYFNPVGAHESGRIGEDPQGRPNNLLPFVAQVAIGRRDKVRVFGNDYPTLDGTGVRDYIHVMDLSAGHLAALNFLNGRNGAFRWNLGTGKGSSVLEVIQAFALAAGRKVAYEFGPRRAGDAAVSYADPSAALADLGWTAKRNLAEMCEDHWRWQSGNPDGYSSTGGSDLAERE
jgi:UDP-glucose 4-epimerase